MARRAAATSERPSSGGFLMVAGRQLPYTVTWSSTRRRSYGFVVDGEGAIQFTAPRWVRVAELLAFAERRHKFIERRLAELAARRERALRKEDLAGKWCELPEAWYRRAAKMLMVPRLRWWAARVGVTVGTVRITSGRTVWGSCNSHGNISLSWRLMQVPEPLRDYVILHEVCHRKHMNHGVRFWALVGKYVPDYLEKRRALNKMGGEIG
ncbi:MAG: DUF45 domain-containing protein [Proteobacteria bacterium]|nr:DUF45 domain-containing protein [Pseudomonadota bacterium]